MVWRSSVPVKRGGPQAGQAQTHMCLILLVAWSLPSSRAVVAAPAAPRRVQLVVDPEAVAAHGGVAVVFGTVTKAQHNPLFAEDHPWEAANRNTYPTAAWDASDQMYKVWYSEPSTPPWRTRTHAVHRADGLVGLCASAALADTNTMCMAGSRGLGFCPHLGYNPTWLPSVMGEHRTATLYAESTDGLSFTKPNLGIVSWNGSKSNNIVLDAGANDYNRGVFLDGHDQNASRRFKLFGGVEYNSTGSRHTCAVGAPCMVTAVSRDGKHWTDITSATGMSVAGDTANNAMWDADLGQYLAFSRRHCDSDACHIRTSGNRRETRSTSQFFNNDWTNATECAHGEGGESYEMYSLTPFRSEAWRGGLYFAVGSFYAESAAEGKVYCELMTSRDHGATWQRLAPHKEFIPHSTNGSYPAGWDSHTCFSANGLIGGADNETTRFY